jgi:ABC-type Fe3+/spermidine/putrescine transport system ATPase subunit
MADRMAVLDAGRVAQVGDPRGLYARPASRFVAGFIGETNFVEGKIARVTGHESPVTSHESRVEVETAVGRIRSNVAPEGIREGDRVTCSIRPEAITVGPSPGADGRNALSGVVVDVMYLGEIEQYFLRLEDGSSVKAVESNPDAPKARVGERAGLTFDPERVVVLKQ